MPRGGVRGEHCPHRPAGRLGALDYGELRLDSALNAGLHFNTGDRAERSDACEPRRHTTLPL